MVIFENVSKVYDGNIVALKEVTFTVDPGEFLFIVGSSGAGKSTIIRLLVRQEKPTTGQIKFEDIEVPAIPRSLLSLYRQQLGVVFQDLKLIPTKTILENVEFALEIIDKPRNEIKDTAEYLLETVRLQDRTKLFPDQLSGGERQRVAIARALANDPKLLVADEPTGNLDPRTSEEILDILQTINNWGTTVMVVTHDKDIVNKMQTRVLHMKDGLLIKDTKGGYEGDEADETQKKMADALEQQLQKNGKKKNTYKDSKEKETKVEIKDEETIKKTKMKSSKNRKSKK